MYLTRPSHRGANNGRMTALNLKTPMAAKKDFNWKYAGTQKPAIGETVMVRMLLKHERYFAVYSGEDEFDVHRTDLHIKNYRKAWFKYSSRSVMYWRYF